MGFLSLSHRMWAIKKPASACRFSGLDLEYECWSLGAQLRRRVGHVIMVVAPFVGQRRHAPATIQEVGAGVNGGRAARRYPLSFHGAEPLPPTQVGVVVMVVS